MTTKNQDIRIIGQGTYGCVYKPEIECKDSTKSDTDMDYISKIQNNNYFSLDFIKSIDFTGVGLVFVKTALYMEQ